MTLRRYPIVGPFKGQVSDAPSPLADPAAFDSVLNFLFRKGRIQTRPRFNNHFAPPDGAIIRYMITFQDVLLNFHTLILTTQNAFMLTAGFVYNLLTYPGGVVNLNGTALPFGVASLLNATFFVNGSVPLLYSDGEVALKIAGNVPGSGFFLTVDGSGSRLIMASTIEPAPGVVGSTAFPTRVRWSASGNPLEWDPSVDFTAGFNDLVAIPNITGLATLGPNTFVFRSNGITAMFPTGNGLSPYTFENYALARGGIGNKFPYSLAVFNDVAVFVAENDIYMFTAQGGPQAIAGGLIKKAIFKDLEQASGDVVWAEIVPNWGTSFDFLSYNLTIPGPDVTWIFSYDDSCWTRISSANGRLTSIGSVAVA